MIREAFNIEEAFWDGMERGSTADSGLLWFDPASGDVSKWWKAWNFLRPVTTDSHPSHLQLPKFHLMEELLSAHIICCVYFLYIHLLLSFKMGYTMELKIHQSPSISDPGSLLRDPIYTYVYILIITIYLPFFTDMHAHTIALHMQCIFQLHKTTFITTPGEMEQQYPGMVILNRLSASDCWWSSISPMHGCRWGTHWAAGCEKLHQVLRLI